ncbi:putative S-adenosyl-L-methionine-dependent methyltransferase [Dioscorea sansibarensis]
MAWSAENATKAFLRTLKTGNNGMEPDVAEFISAMAAGSGARLMVDVCADTAGSTTLALIAAAQQTGGRVVCIVPGADELQSSVISLGTQAENVELVMGDARELLMGEYRGADFVLVDCDLADHERVFRAAQAGAMEACGGVVVGYNAFHKETCGSRSGGGLRVELLPIGEGLRVSRVPPAAKRSQWVVRVDECTGEEHVFRVRSPQRCYLCW